MTLFDRMLGDTPFNRAELALLVQTAPRRYKVHKIAKRNNRGEREIAQPTAEIKLLQRWIVDNVFRDLPVHDAATAYRKGGSILVHARPHADKRYLLKLDFKNFFPSITANAFEMHLKRYAKNLINDDIQLLIRLLFRLDSRETELRLSIGAPSSPAVSNTVMYPFDEKVQKICRDLKVTYTRYADDLAFSTNVPRVLDVVLEKIRSLCKEIEYPSLALNQKKTVNVSRKHHRQLTGLTLTNQGRVSLGKDKRRILRSMIDHFARGLLDDAGIARLRGLLAFARSVDPSVIDLVEKRVPKHLVSILLPGQI